MHLGAFRRSPIQSIRCKSAHTQVLFKTLLFFQVIFHGQVTLTASHYRASRS